MSVELGHHIVMNAARDRKVCNGIGIDIDQ